MKNLKVSQNLWMLFDSLEMLKIQDILTNFSCLFTLNQITSECNYYYKRWVSVIKHTLAWAWCVLKCSLLNTFYPVMLGLKMHCKCWKVCHHRAQQMFNSQQYKHHREKTTIELHSPSHCPLATTQLNPSLYKNFELLQNDSDTARIFSQPPLISFKHVKNIDMCNFSVKSVFQTSDRTTTWNFLN